MKETKQQWYVSICEKIYGKLNIEGFNIRLTDSQVAKLIQSEYGGEIAKHIANIRRSQCNNRNQPYIHETD